MNKVVNTYWADDRLRTQRVAQRAVPRALPALPRLPPAREISRDLIGTRTEVRRRGGVIPSWVILTTIIAAIFAIGVSVNIRSHNELKSATAKFEAAATEVNAMRATNTAMAEEVKLLQQSDPTTIEAAARLQLGMVRPNETVVVERR